MLAAIWWGLWACQPAPRDVYSADEIAEHQGYAPYLVDCYVRNPENCLGGFVIRQSDGRILKIIPGAEHFGERGEYGEEESQISFHVLYGQATAVGKLGRRFEGVILHDSPLWAETNNKYIAQQTRIHLAERM